MLNLNALTNAREVQPYTEQNCSSLDTKKHKNHNLKTARNRFPENADLLFKCPFTNRHFS